MDTATSTRPRFRTDLVAQPIEDKGQVFVDVTDPDSGTTFRFYEIEYSVACAMDGEKDLPALRAWARDEIGVEPTDEELSTVIATLAELGYLDRSTAPRGRPAAAAVPGGAAVAGQGHVELGSAGRSSARTSRPPPATEDVELGHAGAGAPARAAVPATGADEASFEGVMDDDGVPSEASRAGTNPFARTSLPIQAGAGDEAAAPSKPALRSGAAESLRERARQADDEDGPTNIPPPASQFDEDEVSVDLSDHLPIGTDDVKEAVRQSRVMEAAEPPPGLGEESAPARAEAKPAKPAAPPAREESVAPSRSAQLAAVAKPTEPPAAAAESGGNGARIGLIAALVVALLSAAGYYAYAHLGLFGDDSEGVAPADAEAAAEPEPPKAALSEEDVEPVFLEASQEGEVSWVSESGAPVSAGDELIRLAGYEKAAEALERQIGEEARLQDRLDQATAEDDRRAMRQLEAKVEEAQAAVAAAEEELDGFRVIAPEGGTFEPEVEEGAALEVGDPVGMISAEPRAVGVFELEEADAFSEGQSVTLTSEGAGEVASCEVIAAGAMTITVACPPGSPFGPGDNGALESY